MKKRTLWRSLLAVALVVSMFASVLPMQILAVESQDELTKTDTISGGEVVITFNPNGENPDDVAVSGTNASGAQVNLNGSSNTTSNSETAADGTVKETETTIVGMTGTETADGVKKDVTYDQTTVNTTITKPDGTVQETTVIDGKETKEWDVEEDGGKDVPPVDLNLKPGGTVTGTAKVEGSETSGTTTLEDGTIVTESSYEVDRKVDATTSEITTSAEKTTTDMSPIITDIGIDYSTSDTPGKVRWDYHVAYDEDGNPVIFTSGKALTNSLVAGEYDFYWYGEKPLSSSDYFDCITGPDGTRRIVPRVARTEEDMPDWLKASGNYKKNSEGLWVPCSDLSSKEIIAGSSEDFEFAFSGYGGISGYGMLLKSGDDCRWNERYFDQDGDGEIDLVWEPINNGRVTDKEGNVYYVYCLDADTGTLTGYTYNIENVQDVDYFSGTEEEQQMKKDQVTAIALNGFWGSENEGDLGNIDTIKRDLIKFLEETDTFSFTYTDPYAYMVDGEEAPADRIFTAADREELIKLVDLLDEGGALAVTQSALWEYGNRGTNDPVMVFDRTGVSDDPNVNYAMALYRAYLLSDELREQVKAEQENKATTIYDANTSFIAEESLKLTVGDKIEDLDLAENNDEDDTNDYYSNDLSFSLVVAPGQQDSLIVSLVDSNGTIISRARIAGTAAEDDGEISPSMLVRENNVYTFQNVPMQEGSNVTFDLKLEGVQHLEEGVYIYKASSDDFADAQTMVGLAKGSHDVNASSSFTVNFNVEETNRVHSEAVWHREGDPTEKPPKENLPPPPTEEIFEEDPPLKDTPEEPPVEDIPEEDPPLEDIFEEEVPLADVPHTGDNSIYFVIMSVLAVMGLAALTLTKKREMI